MLCELSHEPAEAATLAQRIGEKILARLNQSYVLGAHLHRSACSIGATLFGRQPQSAAELLKQADIAMYQIKARNGSGLCFFDPQMQVEIHQRVRMEGDLRQAWRSPSSSCTTSPSSRWQARSSVPKPCCAGATRARPGTARHVHRRG